MKTGRKVKKVLLLHGIFQSPGFVEDFKLYLGSLGYVVQTFSYPLLPRKEDLEDIFLECLHDFSPEGIVGHSLGGLVAASNIAKFPKSVRSLVCVGSPLTGSLAAKRCATLPTSIFVSVAANNLLVNGVNLPETTVRIGSIAGTSKDLGMGTLFWPLEGESDGAVLVKETFVPGLTDHLQLKLGHKDLIRDQAVATHISNFFEYGKFT